MPVKWKICLYGNDRTKIERQKLHYAAQEAGCESELIDMETMWNDLLGHSDERACIYLDGPIRCTLLTTLNRPNWIPGSWHDKELFRCMSYYGHWGKHIVQQDYAFMPLGDLSRRIDWVYREFGDENGHVFIRPDYGEKMFTGQLIATENFKKWWAYDDVESMDQKSPVIVSRPVKIYKELRLVMLNGKVKAGSTYAIQEHMIMEPLDEQSDKTQIVDFAEMVSADNPPPLPRCYVLDVALTDVGYQVMEIGCVSAAGFYKANLVDVAKAITEAAEQDWEAYFNTEKD